jgi:2-polyprenyl-3-methyl-5-hydroxy-6-metoxy-1,4-benzoquinol methylase
VSNPAQLAQEAEFFDRWAEESIKNLRPLDAAVIDRYRKPGMLFPKEYCLRLVGDLRGKRILDVGCGEGEDSVLLAKLGAIVTGFDVSPGAIRVAQRRAELDGVADRVSFVCSPLDQAMLPPREFDVIWFNCILHHVLDELDSVMHRILASAKPGATLLCIEPISLSKTLRKIRFLVPVHTEVTPGERPLENRDLAVIQRVVPIRRHHFNFLGRLIRFIIPDKRYERASWARRRLTDLVVLVDRIVLSVPGLARLGGMAVLYGRIV